MSFDWLRYIDLAEAMCQSVDALEGNTSFAEAAYRGAICRAFYGVYRPCRVKHLQLWGQDPVRLSGKGNHRELVISFEQKAHGYDGERKRALKKLADHLDRLLVSRRHADYEDDFPNTAPARAARLAIKSARVVSTALSEL